MSGSPRSRPVPIKPTVSTPAALPGPFSPTTTTMSFSSSASGSACGSGPSMSAPASSNSSSASVKYATFVRHQGNDFVKKIETLIHNERESRSTHKYQPVKEFPDNTSVCDMFLVVGAPPRKPPILTESRRDAQGLCPGTPRSTLNPFSRVLSFSSAAPSSSSAPATPPPPQPSPQPPTQISIAPERGSSPFPKLSGLFKLKSSADSPLTSPLTFRSSGRLKKTRARSYSTGESSDIFHPKVLFKYPIEKDIDINGITYMCFPDGAVPQKVVEKRYSKAVLLENHRDLENSFVFLVTGNAKIRYGVCVYKEVVAYQTESQIYIQPLCFCIISSLPFFQFHVNSLMSMLDMEGITDLHSIPSDRLNALLKDAIDASLSQADAPQCDDPEYSPTLSPSSNSPLKNEQECDTNKDNDEKDVNDVVSDSDDEEKDVKGKERPVGADDGDISLDLDGCESKPFVDSPDDVKYKKILLSIVRYCNLKLPPARAPLVYFNITMSYPLIVNRPECDEESKFLQEYGSSTLLHVFPLSTIIQLITALLLEYKVIIVSSSKRLLSSLVLSLLPLLRPFNYQSSVVPVLPLALLAYLEAPVPLLVGLTRQPRTSSTDRFFVVNVHTGEVQCTKPLPSIPNSKELIPKLEGMLRSSRLAGSAPATGIKHVSPAWFSGEENIRQIDSFSNILKEHFLKIFESFESYCITEVGKSSSVSVFMRESFVENASPEDKTFLNEFIQTQIFINYEDTRLRLLDIQKTQTHNQTHNTN